MSKNEEAIALYNQIQVLKGRGCTLAEKAMQGDEETQEKLSQLKAEIVPLIEQRKALLTASS